MATVVSSSEMEGKVMLCCVWLVKPGEGVLRAKFEKTLSPCTKRPCEHRSWRACPSVWPFLLRACSRGEDPYERLETMETLSYLQQQTRPSAEELTCVIHSRSREARDVLHYKWLGLYVARVKGVLTTVEIRIYTKLKMIRPDI